MMTGRLSSPQRKHVSGYYSGSFPTIMMTKTNLPSEMLLTFTKMNYATKTHWQKSHMSQFSVGICPTINKIHRFFTSICYMALKPLPPDVAMSLVFSNSMRKRIFVVVCIILPQAPAKIKICPIIYVMDKLNTLLLHTHLVLVHQHSEHVLHKINSKSPFWGGWVSSLKHQWWCVEEGISSL